MEFLKRIFNKSNLGFKLVHMLSNFTIFEKCILFLKRMRSYNLWHFLVFHGYKYLLSMMFSNLVDVLFYILYLNIDILRQASSLTKKKKKYEKSLIQSHYWKTHLC